MKMMNMLLAMVVIAIGLIGLSGCVTSFSTTQGLFTEIGVGSESIEVPSAIILPAPPSVVVIPGTYAYFAPDIPEDLFFYGGYWYRPYGGYWYQSLAWDGTWVFISAPPVVFLELPTNYRVIFYGFPRIHHHEFQGNWHRWERERHWDRDSHWNQHGSAIRQMPRHQLEPKRNQSSQQQQEKKYSPSPRRQAPSQRQDRMPSPRNERGVRGRK